MRCSSPVPSSVTQEALVLTAVFPLAARLAAGEAQRLRVLVSQNTWPVLEGLPLSAVAALGLQLQALPATLHLHFLYPLWQLLQALLAS